MINYYESESNVKAEEQEEDDELKQTKDKEQQILVEVDDYNIVRQQQQSTAQEPWRGPKSYKCNRAAGYPAICGYCGEQGEIHYNIKEWLDIQGTYHLTHVGCGKLYCDSVGVEPRPEETYKVK